MICGSTVETVVAGIVVEDVIWSLDDAIKLSEC